MNLIIITGIVFIILILYVLFGPYIINIKCSLQGTNFNFLLSLCSFLNLFRLQFTIKECSINLDFIIFRQKISFNKFFKKKEKRKDSVEKFSQSLHNLKKLTKSKQLPLLKKSISAFNLKKCKMKLIFGSSDPYVTGIVSAWLLPLAIHSDSIDFCPEFEEQEFKFLAEVLLPIVVYKIIILFLGMVVRSSYTSIKNTYKN